MRLLVFTLIFFPISVFAQEIRGLEDRQMPFPEGYSMGFPDPRAVVHGISARSSDSIARKDTADFYISCGCSGNRKQPQIFVNGKQVLSSTLISMMPNDIVEFSIKKEGEYADAGAVFVKTKKRLKKRDFHSLASYLRKQFRHYDKREPARYIINGTEYPDPEILLHRQRNEVVSVGVSFGTDGEEVVDDLVKTYTITTREAKTSIRTSGVNDNPADIKVVRLSPVR